MRELTEEEIEQALDDNGESHDGFVAVEATVQELADSNTSTACVGNQAFTALAENGYRDRLCRGWLDKAVAVVSGMFHIQVQADEAKDIEEIASMAGGSLRFSGDSLWAGFKEFEIE